MIKTIYYDDFLRYYEKAHKLQLMNENIIPRKSVEDDLMDSVHIYDCVERRMAGFSKVLEDLHGKRSRKDLQRFDQVSLPDLEFHFIHLFHRYSGSGASFQPRLLEDGSLNPKEHGYNNTICDQLSKVKSIKEMKDIIVNYQGTMCTSVGNQGPSLKNPYPEKYRLSIQYYFDVHAENFLKDYLRYVSEKRRTLKEAVDYSLDWHSFNGMKRWNFVITAFVMDDCEYYPQYVDPWSDVYIGKNAEISLKLMFNGIKKSEYDAAMRYICEECTNKSYCVEDILCDTIRYWKNYIPTGYKKIYKNNSLIKEIL